MNPEAKSTPVADDSESVRLQSSAAAVGCTYFVIVICTRASTCFKPIRSLLNPLVYILHLNTNMSTNKHVALSIWPLTLRW